MKRSWRLTLEVGNPDSPRAITSDKPAEVVEPAKPSLDAVWPMLVDARHKMIDAMANGADSKVADTNSWIGGALAAAAVLTGNSAEALRDRLLAEVPTPSFTSPYERLGEFRSVERRRPSSPPGAPKPIDPATLTPEEREELGIVMPEASEPEP